MADSRQQGILKFTAGQQCRPEYPGAVPQGWSNNGGGEAGIKEEGQNSLPSHAVQALHVADPAADDDHIRIQDVDHVGQRLAKQQMQPVDGELGHVVMSRRRRYLGQREVTFRLGLVPGLQCRAADEGLDATALAAVALGAVG